MMLSSSSRSTLRSKSLFLYALLRPALHFTLWFVAVDVTIARGGT